MNENTINNTDNIKINFDVNEFNNRFEIQFNSNNFEKQLKQFNDDNDDRINITNAFIKSNNFYVQRKNVIVVFENLNTIESNNQIILFNDQNFIIDNQINNKKFLDFDNKKKNYILT